MSAEPAAPWCPECGPTCSLHATESPIHDELALERLREGLARWGEDE